MPIVWSITLSAVLLVACGVGESPRNERPAVIPETTVVADGNTRGALREFALQEGTLRFDTATAQLEELEVGDVLVSEPSDAAPYGYLRRVLAVRRDGAEVVVETEPAALTEAIHRGEADVEAELRPDDLAWVQTYVPGVTTRVLAPDPERRAQLDGASVSVDVVRHGYDYEVAVDTVLDLEAEDGDVGGSGQVRVTGIVRFNAGYGVGFGIDACLEIPPVCIDRFEARVGVQQFVSLKTSAKLEGRVKKEIVVATYYFKPIILWVGPVPVVIVPKVNIMVGASGEARATFELGAEESAQLLIGAKWTDDGGWEDLSKNNGFQARTWEPKFEATMALRAYGKADAKLLVYGIIGPSMDVRLGAGIDVQVPRKPLWKIHGHLASRFSFQLDIADVIRLDVYEKELFELNPEILSAGNYAPRFSNVVTDPIRVALGTRVVLGPRSGFQGYFDVRDPDGDPVTLSATSDVDGSIPLSVTFGSVGPRRVTITARDPDGATASAVLRVEVTNSLPIIYTTVASDTVPATVPYWVGARAYDPESGELPCNRLDWSVSAPDAATAVDNAGGCGAWVVFGAEGSRTVTVGATDPQGGRASKSLSVNVTPAPQDRPPVITHFSVQAYKGPKDPLYCVTGFYCEVPEGAVLYNGQVGDYHPPLFLSVSATDDRGAPLAVTWTCRTGSQLAPVTKHGDGTHSCSPIYSATEPISVRVEVSDGTSATPRERRFIMLQRVN